MGGHPHRSIRTWGIPSSKGRRVRTHGNTHRAAFYGHPPPPLSAGTLHKQNQQNRKNPRDTLRTTAGSHSVTLRTTAGSHSVTLRTTAGSHSVTLRTTAGAGAEAGGHRSPSRPLKRPPPQCPGTSDVHDSSLKPQTSAHTRRHQPAHVRSLDGKPRPFPRLLSAPQGGKKMALRGGGGGGDTEAHFPNPPPPPSLAAVTGGGGVQGGGARPAVPGGGGVNPTSMAQNDTHVALIILTTQMLGGGDGIIGGKNFFGPNFCVPVPLAPTSVLTQNKGPDTEPHFSNPPPPLLRRASMSPPPPRRAIFTSPNPLQSRRGLQHRRAEKSCPPLAHPVQRPQAQPRSPWARHEHPRPTDRLSSLQCATPPPLPETRHGDLRLSPARVAGTPSCARPHRNTDPSSTGTRMLVRVPEHCDGMTCVCGGGEQGQMKSH